VFPAYFSEVFPPALRFSGMAVGFTIGTIAGNAFAPAIAASILGSTGSWIGIAWYMAGSAVVSFVAGVFLRVSSHTADEPLATERSPAGH
jgi:MFS family permease